MNGKYTEQTDRATQAATDEKTKTMTLLPMQVIVLKTEYIYMLTACGARTITCSKFYHTW